MAEQQSGLRCPRCGSEEVYEYRMGIHRYRIDHGIRRFDGSIRESEDPIFHRCVDCQHASDENDWGTTSSDLGMEMNT